MNPADGRNPIPLSPVVSSRLEKAALDNGFDQEQPGDQFWRRFSSTQCPLQVWLGAAGEAAILSTFSRQNVADSLAEFGESYVGPIPTGALAGRMVSDFSVLHRLLRRAFQLSRSLPDELLQEFERKTRALPRATEAERLVVQRVGQDVFREGLLDFWEGRCAITGLAVPELLRASHIKPWADCENDHERLDVWNGLLLAPQLDAVFDRGFLTVADDGSVVLADTLSPEARRLLGIDQPLCVRALADGHRKYLLWHREQVFRGARGGHV